MAKGRKIAHARMPYNTDTPNLDIAERKSAWKSARAAWDAARAALEAARSVWKAVWKAVKTDEEAARAAWGAARAASRQNSEHPKQTTHFFGVSGARKRTDRHSLTR